MKIATYEETKLGYGNPKGTVWFIGPEEGGSIESWQKRIRTWENQQVLHFADLKKFHLDFREGTERFFNTPIKLQRTWSGLIDIYFGMKGLHNADKREFQSNELGSLTGDTCLIELMPFASRKLNDEEWNQNMTESKEQYIDRLAENRMQLIANKIKEYSPKWVVFYGKKQAQQWHRIIELLNVSMNGTRFDENLQIEFIASITINFAIIPHPVSFAMNGIKQKVGQKLAEF